MARARSAYPESSSSAHVGFEAKLWLAADKLRNNVDATEYKHVVLGDIFLKYITRYKGRIDDSACSFGAMFVQSEKCVESHSGQLGDIFIDRQESNPSTRRPAVMNLARRGIEADFVLANGRMSSNRSGEGQTNRVNN